MPRIQHKRGTSANLASVNPTPLAGELVWDSTENAIKIGDGSTAWTSLAYVTATPRTHTHSADAITSGTIEYARLPVGSTSSTVCAGDDARLTDARAPTAHKATHATGGSDALTPGDIGAAPAASPTFTGTATFELVSTLSITALVSSWFDDDVRPKIFTTSGSAGDFNAEAGHLAMQPRTSTGVPRDIIFGGGNGAATERMRIRGTNGRVGIGTATPATLLDVAGVITVSATSGSAGSYLPSVTFSGDPNTGFGQVSGQSDTASIFTAGHERVRVTSGGNVGIGTASPATPGSGKFSLDVNGPVIARGGVAAHQTSGGVLDLSGDVLRIRSYGATAGSGVIDFRIGGGGGSADAQGARLDASANFILGSTVSPTGSRVMMLVNGTAPSASIGDCVMLYSEDVSSSAELKVRDEAGNVTTLSPHNFDLIPEGPSEPMAWAYYSERDGHRINVDMLRLARLVERLTGEKLVYEAGP